MYQAFASVYDEFMADVPYTVWADAIEKILKVQDSTPDRLLDLACGTGGLAIEMSRRGYQVIGCDQSEDMLAVAYDHAAEAGEQILFLQQDMRSFELLHPVPLILSTCDSINYMLTEEDLTKTFCQTARWLCPKGLLIFDVKSEYLYRTQMADHTFAQTYEDAAYIWENAYDPQTGFNRYDVTFFVADEDGRYERYEEEHVQRAWSLDTLARLAKQQGLVQKAVYDGLTCGQPQAKSERLFFVFQKD